MTAKLPVFGHSSVSLLPALVHSPRSSHALANAICNLIEASRRLYTCLAAEGILKFARVVRRGLGQREFRTRSGAVEMMARTGAYKTGCPKMLGDAVRSPSLVGRGLRGTAAVEALSRVLGDASLER